MKNKILNIQNPINLFHPLNRGLVAEWICVPSLMGRRLIDLCRRNDGTFITGPKWRGSTRIGSYGGMKFDANGDYVTLPNKFGTMMSSNPNYSVSFWIYSTVSGAGVDAGTILSNGGNPYGPYFSVGANRANWYTGGWMTGTVPIPLNVWTNVLFTLNGTIKTIYINGKLDAQENGFSTNSWLTAATYIGERVDLNNTPINGYMDSIQCWKYCLSESSIKSLYQESKRGNPNRLNWMSTTKYFLPSTIIRTRYRRSIFTSWIDSEDEE